jgi:cellulose biosynthesis protein BcsQ
VTVSPTVIYRRAAFSNSAITGQAAQEYEPRGKAASEIAALFRNIASHLGLSIHQIAETVI